ncbi:unnamed protein product [Symbiodinium sp. CCMP2592]|nr:unnamed protein product [Symbiodinium sp. CCMP2592]
MPALPEWDDDDAPQPERLHHASRALPQSALVMARRNRGRAFPDGVAKCRLCPFRRKCADPVKAYAAYQRHFLDSHPGEKLGLAPACQASCVRVLADGEEAHWRCKRCQAGISTADAARFGKDSLWRFRREHKTKAHPRVSWAVWNKEAKSHSATKWASKISVTRNNAQKAKLLPVLRELEAQDFDAFGWPRQAGKDTNTVDKYPLRICPAWVCRKCRAPCPSAEIARKHRSVKGQCPSRTAKARAWIRLRSLAANKKLHDAAPASVRKEQGELAFAAAEKALRVNVPATAGIGYRNQWKAHGRHVALSAPEDLGSRVALVSDFPFRHVQLCKGPASTRHVAGLFNLRSLPEDDSLLPASSRSATDETILVVAFYGQAGNEPVAQTQVDEVLECAVSSGYRFVVLGDYNLEPSQGRLGSLISQGIVLAGDECARGRPLPATGPVNAQGVRTRRIDFAVNHRDLPAVSVDHFTCDFSDHLGVHYSYALDAPCPLVGPKRCKPRGDLQPSDLESRCAQIAAFQERCLRIGMTPELYGKLKDKGYDTFGKIAFAAASSPQALTDEAIDVWLATVVDPRPSAFQVSVIRRLLFESQSLNIADLRTRVEGQPENTIKKLPTAERIARQEAQQARLKGVVFTVSNQPSHASIDQVTDMLENNSLRYLPMNRWTSRSQELSLAKKDSSIQIDAEGNLKLGTKVPDPVCDTNGAYALRQAFFRRSLALDLGNLCTFEVMEEWVNTIFELTQRQVPTGYTKVSLSQIVAADKELFIRAANNLEGKLQKPVGATKPLDAELKRLSVSHDITQFLSPLLTPPPPAHPNKRPQDGDDDAPPKKTKGKGDKGNKGGGKGKTPRLTYELLVIEGPYTEAQVTEIFGHSDWGIIPRFVLEQGLEKKIRPIDDGHASQVNEAFTSLIKLELQGADFVAGLALLISQAEKERSERLGVAARKWVGRTLDLSKAYKQLGVLPQHRDIAVICHPNENGEPQFFIANALMFGLTSSVYGFVRVARSLHFLLAKVLKIPSANYFDDYPLFTLRDGAHELDGLTSEFLELLGWRFAQTGVKGQPYEEAFTVLGMQLDISRLHEGAAVLANKEGRVKRISEMLGSIFDKGALGRHEAQVLLGLLNYASGFFAGRSLKPACHFLLSLVRGKRQTAAEIKRFCKTTQAVLSTTPPRVLRIFDPRPPIHVWTDGAWEDPWAGIGAVVLDTLDDSARVFAGCVPAKLLERWKLDVGSQLICEIELYALAARTSAIKGLSQSESMYRLAHYLAVIEAEVRGTASSAWLQVLSHRTNDALLVARIRRSLRSTRLKVPSLPYARDGDELSLLPHVAQLIETFTQQEEEARKQMWRTRTRADLPRARSFVKRRADEQLAWERQLPDVASPGDPAHPAVAVAAVARDLREKLCPASFRAVDMQAMRDLLRPLPRPASSEVVPNITPEALRRSMQSMRHRAAGPDAWKPGLLCSMPDLWWEWTSQLWNRCCDVPAQWAQARVVMIKKIKGGFRPLTISQAVWRAGARILNAQLSDWIGSWRSPSDAGGIPGTSVSGALLQLNAAMRGGANVAVQQDIAGFFDAIQFEALEVLLSHLKAPPFLWPLLKAFYTRASRIVQLDGAYSDAWFKPRLGIAQGCPLSPTLAAAFSHLWTLAVLRQGVSGLVYLDDRSFWTFSADLGDLEHAIRRSDRFDATCGLEISLPKCAIVAPEDRTGGLVHWCFANGKTVNRTALTGRAARTGPLTLMTGLAWAGHVVAHMLIVDCLGSAPPLPESGIPCPPVNRHVHSRPPALPTRAAPFTPPFQALPELQAAPPLPNPQGMVVSVSNKRPRASKQDGRGMQAIRAHSAACSQIAVNLMLQLLAFLGSESSFFSAIQSAVHFDAHVRRVLAGFAATTVIRYITTFNSFATACEDLDVCLLEITAVQAADILVTLQLQRQEDPTVGSSAITCIKAVRWVCKNTQCIVFEVFYGELISSFLKTKLPKDRRESLPLPLYALVQWERRILQRSTPVRDIVLLGAFLVTCWASLRFADSQRIEWSSFAFDVVSLRAIAYQTKTSHQGQPFGLITQGFLHHGTHSWVARWLRVLDSIASQEVRDFGVAPSFLFPALDDDAELLRPLEPMSYPSCLRWLRYYLQFPWMVSPPEVPVSNYTVHSMKCSLLSYMLEVPDIRGPDRDAQGHHRGSSRELYSRDDVLGALRAQTQLRSAVLADFRPRTPLHRGAQLPMAPIPFTLEAFSKEIDPAPWGFFSFDVGVPGSLPWVPGQSSACAAETPAAEASTKAAEPSLPDSASEAGSESSLEPEAGPASLGPPDEVHMVAATGVVHAACPSGERTLCGIGHGSALDQPLQARTVVFADRCSRTMADELFDAKSADGSFNLVNPSPCPLKAEGASSFNQLLQDHGISQELTDRLLADGWDAKSFRHVVCQESELAGVLPEMFPDTEVSLMQRAKLRAVWSSLQRRGNNDPAPAEPLGSPAKQGSGWSEAFAPKLDATRVATLKKRFLEAFPSEILTAMNTPSLRLLSTAVDAEVKKNWSWIPWKSRMTQQMYEDSLMQKPAKRARIETLQLSDLLLDEPPQIDINDSTMGISMIRRLLEVHDNALALAGTAHLARLKAYTSKFLSLVSQKFPPETNLRPPSVLEAQQADKHLWSCIFQLVIEKEWQVNDAIYEFTEIRGDMSSWLQPRAKAASAGSRRPYTPGGRDNRPPTPPPGRGNGKGKGKAKSPTKQGTQPRGVPWVREYKEGGQVKKLCIGWQIGKCQRGNSCEFTHGCVAGSIHSWGELPAPPPLPPPIPPSQQQAPRGSQVLDFSFPPLPPQPPSADCTVSVSPPQEAVPSVHHTGSVPSGDVAPSTCTSSTPIAPIPPASGTAPLGHALEFSNFCGPALAGLFDCILCSLREAPWPQQVRRAHIISGASSASGYFNFGVQLSRRSSLTQVTIALPELCRDLNALFRFLFPNEHWNALCVSRNGLSALHSDSANIPGSRNLSLSLGAFSGGHLWIEDLSCLSQGQPTSVASGSGWLHGCAIDTHRKAISFDGRIRHMTLPFSGERWALTAFSLPDVCCAELEFLGFPLPSPLLG